MIWFEGRVKVLLIKMPEELYDLIKDPMELENLANSNFELLGEARSILKENQLSKNSFF